MEHFSDSEEELFLEGLCKWLDRPERLLSCRVSADKRDLVNSAAQSAPVLVVSIDSIIAASIGDCTAIFRDLRYPVGNERLNLDWLEDQIADFSWIVSEKVLVIWEGLTLNAGPAKKMSSELIKLLEQDYSWLTFDDKRVRCFIVDDI